MNRNLSRQESLALAKEKMRQKKEKEEREEKEFYERITSGNRWIIFKSVVIFCTLMALITTIEVFVDGPSKKLTEEEWEINHDWDYPFHYVLDVEGNMFTPHFTDWSERVENSLEIVYSPIFRQGKKLYYPIQEEDAPVRWHEEYRQRSIYNWFPELQILFLIPLVTFIFRRQSPMFNFARIASLFFVFPGSLMILFFAIF